MSDVIKAVTDQFALINVDSDADLRAVGAALCQIPEGMSPLSEGFTSFRHEVLHAILMTGEAEGLAERAVVLDKCLTSIEDSPDLAEQGIALQILAEELREGFLTNEAANSDVARRFRQRGCRSFSCVLRPIGTGAHQTPSRG